MWLAAARRFGILLGALSAGAAIVGLVIGAFGSYALDRSVAVSYYIFGVALLVVGFFVTSRGPVRPRREGERLHYGAQAVRWATRTEQEETLNLSAVLIALGFTLILIGVAVDGRHSVA
jgi:hypothetical protein